ncbi:MAG: diacylglycerol kinase family protein, partial [Bacteroidota bacterium]
SFGYAFKGIATLIRTQAHAKVHLLAIALITPLGLWLGLSVLEWCLIVLCMGLVLSLEGVNTAIEFTVDLASPDHHPLAGKAKDVAAGAVLIAAIFAAIIWGLIFIPKLYDQWQLWISG